MWYHTDFFFRGMLFLIYETLKQMAPRMNADSLKSKLKSFPDEKKS